MTVQSNNADWIRIIIISVLFIAVLALYSANASALITRQISLIDKLQSDLSMTESISISITDNTDDMFSISLPDTAHSIMANGELMSNNTVNISLNCTSCNIQISFDMDNVVKKDNRQYLFYRTLHFPQSPQQLRYVVYMPDGYTVNSTDTTNPSIVPNPTSILTDGTHIMVSWIETNPQLPKQYYVRFQGPEQIESMLFFVQNDLGHPITIMMLLLILVIGIVSGYFLKILSVKKIEKPIKQKTMQHLIPSSLLSPDEKKVMGLLQSKDAKKNPVNQKDIGTELNWSKSKVSAVLSNLYYKKLIDREKFGRNYKVRLLKDVEQQ